MLLTIFALKLKQHVHYVGIQKDFKLSSVTIESHKVGVTSTFNSTYYCKAVGLGGILVPV